MSFVDELLVSVIVLCMSSGSMFVGCLVMVVVIECNVVIFLVSEFIGVVWWCRVLLM